MADLTKMSAEELQTQAANGWFNAGFNTAHGMSSDDIKPHEERGNIALAELTRRCEVPKGHVKLDDGRVVKVLGTPPMTADECLVGDVRDHGALVFLNGPGDKATPYRMTLCVRCVANPDDESKNWEVVENDELKDGAGRWYASREAALAAQAKGVTG